MLSHLERPVKAFGACLLLPPPAQGGRHPHGTITLPGAQPCSGGTLLGGDGTLATSGVRTPLPGAWETWQAAPAPGFAAGNRNSGPHAWLSRPNSYLYALVQHHKTTIKVNSEQLFSACALLQVGCFFPSPKKCLYAVPVNQYPHLQLSLQTARRTALSHEGVTNQTGQHSYQLSS